MYAHTSSSHGRRGIFAAKHLWVTPHSEEERWPAGMFPLQRPGEYSRGIADWTKQVPLLPSLVSCSVQAAQIASLLTFSMLLSETQALQRVQIVNKCFV